MYRATRPVQQSSAPGSELTGAIQLLPSDLRYTMITVSHSLVRPNEQGKEALSFVVSVNPGHGKEGWKVEKWYDNVLRLDQLVRNRVGKDVAKMIASLPQGKLLVDHAPAKADQRKVVLEYYLQTLMHLPVQNNNEVIAFFTSDVVQDQRPATQPGYKEGYLTKRGKNFGAWKTRFFVVQGPTLEYYERRGGTHLGSIVITGAQIGRQQRQTGAPPGDEKAEYRHAFLIIEARKGPGGSSPRHVLCADSDEERDNWVDLLVRFFTGVYSDAPLNLSTHPSQPVFGVPLAEALGVAEIAHVPAVVFRAIQYLEAKNAYQEERIYSLSGKVTDIKRLKDMFNKDADVDLLALDENWDPYAIAGLLKKFLNELPSSIFTQELHHRFLAIVDITEHERRNDELSSLVSLLPLANYNLLRTLFAHLHLIVQNSNVNGMTMHNLGIIFSSTLRIPAPVFGLMLGEFDRIFDNGAATELKLEGSEDTTDSFSEPQSSKTPSTTFTNLAFSEEATPVYTDLIKENADAQEAHNPTEDDEQRAEFPFPTRNDIFHHTDGSSSSNTRSKSYFSNPSTSMLRSENSMLHASSAAASPPDLSTSVTRDSTHPIHGGSYADIYSGALSRGERHIKVAIKVIRAHIYTEANQWKINKRLKREIRVWSCLQHPNIVPLLGTTDGFGPYAGMVCPWMSEGDLNHYLKDRRPSLTLKKRLQILSDVVDGLIYLHTWPIVHGDLSTGNILMDDGKAHLSDFGLSTLMAETRNASLLTSTVGGAVRWAAPELYQVDADPNNTPEATKPCDVYSFGCVALEVTSGKMPFYNIITDYQVLLRVMAGQAPARPAEALLTDAIWELITLCWTRDPHQRPSMEEVRGCLHNLKYSCSADLLESTMAS